MKKGDLVKPKVKYASGERLFGIILKIEENFYTTYNDCLEDRLTIYWTHGETTFEPDSYLEVVNEKR